MDSNLSDIVYFADIYYITGKSGGLVFHHEQAQPPLWPSKVFFCCVLPAKPGDGGATGLASSAEVYNLLKAKHPEFMRKCEEE